MKKFLVLGLVLSAFSGYVCAQRSNCGVSPETNTFTQPDGSRLTLRAFGTEAVHYAETMEGYTVLRNNDGIFEYAIKGMDGNLTLSGTKASDKSRIYGKAEWPQHLRYSPQQLSALVQLHEKSNDPVLFGKKAGNVFPPNGNRKIMVILMDHADLAGTYSKSNFQLLFNQANYNGTGSFRDYYQKASYGALNITVDVYGWFRTPNGYKYYKNATSSLLQRAAFCADSAGADFTQYDSDNDGYVDAVMVMHAGLGAEEASVGEAADFIWSFRSTTSSATLYDGKRLSAFAMFPEKRYGSGTYPMVGIGVMTHEFGHILDLPDLYATAYNNTGGGPEGVGNFANMAGGPWLNNERTPCMHDAWSKIQLGWVTPVLINNSGTFTIPKSVADSNFVYRINTPRSNEYFLLENKQKKGFDRYIPDEGLAIWHINSSMAGKLSQKSNNANNDTSNLGVGLLQADGERDLEYGNNRGDNMDLYPYIKNGTPLNTGVTPKSNPSSALYYKIGGVHQNSNLYITNITQQPDSSITFNFGAVANAAYVPSTTLGCAPLTVAFANESNFTDDFLWNFKDGVTSTLESPVHTFNLPGKYEVCLNVRDSLGVLVDSMKQVIEVVPPPHSAFEISRVGNVITVVNRSTGSDTYNWQFGGYSTGMAEPPSLDLKQVQAAGWVKVRLAAVSPGGCTDTSEVSIDIWDPWSAGVEESASASFVARVYPNPSHTGNIAVDFVTPEAVPVSLEIWNVLGEKIHTIPNTSTHPGAHHFELNRELFTSSGIYFVRVVAGKQQSLTKLLIK